MIKKRSRLTTKEIEELRPIVRDLMAEGYTPHEVSRTIGTSLWMVKTHLWPDTKEDKETAIVTKTKRDQAKAKVTKVDRRELAEQVLTLVNELENEYDNVNLVPEDNEKLLKVRSLLNHRNQV